MAITDAITGFFAKKNRLLVTFIDETGHEFDKKVTYKNNVFSQRVHGEPGMYIVDHNFIVFNRQNKPRAYYYTNNPNPIRMQHERNQQLDSLSFKRIMDSKVITDLFAEEGVQKLLIVIILVAATLAVNLIILLVQLKVIKIGTG